VIIIDHRTPAVTPPPKAAISNAIRLLKTKLNDLNSNTSKSACLKSVSRFLFAQIANVIRREKPGLGISHDPVDLEPAGIHTMAHGKTSLPRKYR
jgi:hypothetical protein